MRLLNRLLYSKLYSEETGGEVEGGGAAQADATNDDLSNDNGGDILHGGDNGDGVELLAGKYKTVEELEKGYKESVSMGTKNTEKMNDMTEKLKGFAGAPEGDYDAGDATYSEAVMTELQTWGKDNGLSQDAFSSLVSAVHGADVANAEASRAAEMNKLGKDAQVRIDNVNDKLLAIFGEDLAAQYQGIGRDAAGVEALEQLVGKFSESTANPDGAGFIGVETITQDKLSELMNARDSAGMIKMQTSPEYAKSVYATIDKYNKQRGIGS